MYVSKIGYFFKNYNGISNYLLNNILELISTLVHINALETKYKNNYYYSIK